ncbi:MAG TPA: carbohydrate kinase [Prolixibacteraceae bacterium]|nr:carbohydrate kinase [Prolixibacteraceae bacterium]
MKIKNNQILCIGEILWDNLPSGAKPGGAPMNVALHLNRVGQQAAVASKVGNDKQGKKLLDFLEISGLNIDLVPVDETLPTSEVLVHLDANNNATYEICEPVAWDNLTLTDSLSKKAKESGLIIYGSLASRNAVSRNSILNLLENDALKLIDVNLRKPYDTREIVEVLIRKSDVVKLNDDELLVFAQWNEVQLQDEKSRISWFANHYQSKMVIVTKGDKGAILFADGEFFEHPGFKVNAVDTVGAGDAFLAGFIAALYEGKTNDKALEFACAAGSFVASKAGATPEYNRFEIEQLIISK